MKRVTEDLRSEAQRLFLGRDPVIGVAVAGSSENALVFLLEEESADMERRIREWGRNRCVEVRIQLNGPITLLSS